LSNKDIFHIQNPVAQMDVWNEMPCMYVCVCTWQFSFYVIWHRQSMATLVLCWRLAENDVTVMPSVTYMYYVGDIVTRLMWLPCQQEWLLLPKWVRNVKCTSPGAIQVKNQRNAINIEEILDIISWFEKS
jgi:hypothetical protein